MSASPFSLGVNGDFAVDDESQKAMESLPPEMQAIAKRGLAAIHAGKANPNDPRLAAMGQQALSPQAPPASPSSSGSPYGVPGGKIGPETQDQAINEKLAAQQKAQASGNQQAFQAQFPGPFPGVGQLPAETPVAPRSGLSRHDQMINDFKSAAHDLRPQGMSPDELRAQGQAISDLPAVQRANEGLDNQENYLQMALSKKPDAFQSANLGPLLAMFNPQAAATYKAPETTAAQQARIMAALQKIQTDRQSLAGNVIAGIKASKGGSLGDILTASDNLKQQTGAQDPFSGMGARLEETNNGRFLNIVRTGMKELTDSNAANQEAQRLLASGTSVGDTTFKDRFLKAMIGGRVTNFDLMRQSGDQSLANKAEQLMQSLDSGNMTKMSRAEYQDALRVMQQATEWEAHRRTEDYRDVGLNNLRLPPERVEAGLSLGGLSHMGAVDPGIIAASVRQTGKAVAPTGGASNSPRIRVIAPDGQSGSWPAGKALPAGYKKAPPQ